MTKQELFDNWWGGNCWCVRPNKDDMQIAFFAGLQADINAELRQKLLAIAVECFKAHDHERARFYQDLADEKHSIWNL